jgi:hypothetical protein
MINVAVAGLTLLITDTQRRELLHLDLNGHLLRTERVRLPPFNASKLHDGTIYCSWTQTPHFVYYTSPDHLEVVELTEFSTPFNFSVNTPAGFYIVRGQTADIYRLRNMRILENMSSVALQLTQSKKSRKSSQDAPEKNAEITYNLAVVDIDYCSDKNIIALLHGNEGGQFPFLWTFNTITGETHEVRSGITGGRLFQSLAFSPNGNVRSWRPAPSGFELVELTL